jgi:uncharacterized metal-binding protein YceD (DUF177 family)
VSVRIPSPPQAHQAKSLPRFAPEFDNPKSMARSRWRSFIQKCFQVQRDSRWPPRGIVNPAALPHLSAMSDQPLPYTSFFELARLSERGVELSLLPDASERARIAAWLGALALPRLAATIRLARSDDDLYRYEAEFTAEVVQACVVTLEPVPSVHSGEVTRRDRVAAKPSRRPQRAVEIDLTDDEEAPEVLSSSLLDVAAPLLEELALMLDPYPRASGVAFEAPKDEPKAIESPFAVLAKLKVPPRGSPKRGK